MGADSFAKNGLVDTDMSAMRAHRELTLPQFLHDPIAAPPEDHGTCRIAISQNRAKKSRSDESGGKGISFKNPVTQKPSAGSQEPVALRRWGDYPHTKSSREINSDYARNRFRGGGTLRYEA